MMRCWIYQSRQDNQAKQFVRKKLLTGAEDLYLLAKNKKKTDCPNAESSCQCY